MQRGEIKALLERCAAATGPDTGIDAAIAVALGWSRLPPPKDYDRPMPSLWADPAGDVRGALAPCWTGSLDAIVGLIEREFPKSRWETGHYFIRTYDSWGATAHIDSPVAVESGYKNQPFNPISIGHTPALALCAAFLTAKLSLTGADK